jgi:hypothetical protein
MFLTAFSAVQASRCLIHRNLTFGWKHDGSSDAMKRGNSAIRTRTSVTRAARTRTVFIDSEQRTFVVWRYQIEKRFDAAEGLQNVATTDLETHNAVADL